MELTAPGEPAMADAQLGAAEEPNIMSNAPEIEKEAEEKENEDDLSDQ